MRSFASGRMDFAVCVYFAAVITAVQAAPPRSMPASTPVSGADNAFRRLGLLSLASVDIEPLKSYTVQKLREMPHDSAPWTQGLEFSADGRLVETSGNYPRGVGSFIRTLEPETGKVTKKIVQGLDNGAFIEGISELDGHWFATTYEDKVLLEYDANFRLVAKHPYDWEGWGFTRGPDGQSFIATNSSEYVMVFKPKTFELLDVKVASCLGQRVQGLNELELVDDFMGQGPALLGNIVNTRLVLVLDPSTMKCTGTFHLEDLEEKNFRERFGFHVANGIAYNKKSGTFFFTGKNWDHMYEAKLSEEPAGQASQALQSLGKHLGAPAGAFAQARMIRRHTVE